MRALLASLSCTDGFNVPVEEIFLDFVYASSLALIRSTASCREQGTSSAGFRGKSSSSIAAKTRLLEKLGLSMIELDTTVTLSESLT